MARRKPKHPITEARERAGLTGAALARLVGVKHSHILDIERGRIASPRVELALRIAEALKADVRELFHAKRAA